MKGDIMERICGPARDRKLRLSIQNSEKYSPKQRLKITSLNSSSSLSLLVSLFLVFCLIALNIYKLDIFVNKTTDLSQLVADEQELYLIRECRRTGWMERYYMNLNSSELHLLCTIEMSHSA